MTAIEPETIKRLVRSVLTTRPDEIGCEECLARVDRFVDLRLAGRDASQAMPLVEDHLRRCSDCHEEFRALLVAVEARASDI